MVSDAGQFLNHRESAGFAGCENPAGHLHNLSGGYALYLIACLRAGPDLVIGEKTLAHAETLGLPVVGTDGKLSEQLLLCRIQFPFSQFLRLQLQYFLVNGSQASVQVLFFAAQ